jgi:hypothetical protein
MNTTDKKKMQKAADDFYAAFKACKEAKTREQFKAAEPELDRALLAYRKAHGISDAFGLMDCIVHFNSVYA